ncbi:MAG: HAD-IA family hydrolase [Acinetobacter sp.]
MRNQDSVMPIILLDAMGVIYQSGDDVGELLIPFIRDKGSKVAVDVIDNAYKRASLGLITANQFWEEVDISSEFENEYLSLHKLSNGFNDFIQNAFRENLHFSCLSNDVSEWSKKLRSKFKLESFIDDWIISGDIGLRKPDPNIYLTASTFLKVAPEQILFVDDRLANVIAAKKVGFQTILFTQENVDSTFTTVCRNFDELAEIIIKLDTERHY